MTYTPERASVNQRIQVGVESLSALGTPVAANKILQCFDFVWGVGADVMWYRATGRKYDTVQEENSEWTDGTMTGALDYNGVLYPLAGACGAISPVAHGASATAKDWIFSPPVSGSLEPQTYTFQQGEAATRAHQIAFGLFTNFAYKGTRKDFSCAGKMLGQALTDGITLTASPTSVALAPVPAKQVNVYLDPTSAALGTTQMTRVLSVDYMFDAIYGPVWAIDRSKLGWTAFVDMAPKCTMKMKVEADANGMALLGYLQSGNTYFLRVDALGTVIDNLQTVSLGSPSAGNFTLTYKAQTTATIAYNAAAAAVQSALVALSTIGAGNVTVTGSAGGPYSVIFGGTLAQDTTAMTGSGGGLTGGTFLITQNQTSNEFKHDMAIKLDKPASTFADDAGVFAIEWEMRIVEDATWGHAQQFTLTNLLTAL